MKKAESYRCPYCGSATTFVRETRSAVNVILRIRSCRTCGREHETMEMVCGDPVGVIREAFYVLAEREQERLRRQQLAMAE